MPAVPTAASTRERIPHPAAGALDLATVMRTAGDPVRLEILRILADGGERSCTALQRRLGLPASTGSYHLRLLREAGVSARAPRAPSGSSRCAATTSRPASPGSWTS